MRSAENLAAFLEGADQRNPNRNGHGTPATEAVREERINIAEHALEPHSTPNCLLLSIYWLVSLLETSPR
jgi:hypothetical protein